MVNGDLTRYPEVGCPWGARTGEPRAKAGARYCEPGWGPTIKRRLISQVLTPWPTPTEGWCPIHRLSP